MIALDEDYRRIDDLLNEYPLLDNDEIKALARQARAGDVEAREKMILHNLRLVVSIIKPYTSPQTFGDAMQEGIEGLIRAVDKYDPDKVNKHKPDQGYNFSTYAVWWIRQSIRIWIFRKHYAYVPRYMHDAMNIVKKYQTDGVHDPEEIARQTRLTTLQVIAAQEALNIRYASMDMPLPATNGDLTMADFILDERDPFAEIEENESTQQQVTQLMDLLTPREQQLMRLYFGFDGETMTLSEIAPVLGISRERVRQLYTRAMECLKAGKPTPVVKVKPLGACQCGCGEQIEMTLDHGGNRKFVSPAHKDRYYYQQRKEQEEVSA